MTRVALILAGCGRLDGSETHESVLALLALSEAGYSYRCFAPDKSQQRVMNHFTRQEAFETRNILVESARLARGDIAPLSSLNVDDFDAVVIPGGRGAAINLSSYVTEREKCTLDPDFRRIIRECYKKEKSIGAICIAAALVAKALEGITTGLFTMGTDANEGLPLRAMGMQVELAPATELVSDKKNKIYTTPAYMEKASLSDVFKGISKLAKALKNE